MSRYEDVPNPDGVPCKFSQRENAKTWYYWVEPSPPLPAGNLVGQKRPRCWYAGGGDGRAYKAHVKTLKARAESEGFDVVQWHRGSSKAMSTPAAAYPLPDLPRWTAANPLPDLSLWTASEAEFHALSSPASVACSEQASYQQMVQALSNAPSEVLVAAINTLHAPALQRGRLLLPHERLARRGVSSVELNTLPTECSVCAQPGQWLDPDAVDSLICCNDCITAVHQSWVCSRMTPDALMDDGWRCCECHMSGTT